MKNNLNIEEFNNFVYITALENAISFSGKANPKAILGKIIPKYPEIKNNLGEFSKTINEIVEKVNSLNEEKQKKELEKLNPESLNKNKEKKEIKKKDGLPELNVNGKVIVRFEPAPSGHLHLGHLFPIIANYEFKKKYGGKFILRIADTNPDNINIKNYEKVIEDVKWICEGEIDEIIYQSDRLDIYYKYLRQLIETGNAYICKCDSEVFKTYTDSKEMCPCQKEMSIEIQSKKLDKFFNGRYKQGEAVIRAKADINNKNPALRTFPLARINENNHARIGNKHRVWPNMNLAVAIDDSLMNLTHVIRGKDHEINTLRQEMLHKALNMKSPEYFHFGIIKFEDINFSKSELSKRIEDGEFSGWDDPRVPSVLSYRRRGYKAEAFRKFILSLGISKRDSKITSEEYHKGLDFFNKQILEKEANRYFFIHNPKKIHIKNINDIKEKEIILPKHPEDKSKGSRKFKIEENYLIDSIDFNNFEKENLIRLMHFGNFKIINKNENLIEIEFLSKEYDKNLKIKRNIHFLPSKENFTCEIILSDNSKLKGLCEEIHNPKINENIQFERFAFVKFDGINENKEKVFYFTHR